MRRLRSARGTLLGFAAGIAVGAAAALAWPFGTSPEDVGERLMEHRRAAGFAPMAAGCHARPRQDHTWYCELDEAVIDDLDGDGEEDASGHEEYIVRHHGGRWVFDRVSLD